VSDGGGFGQDEKEAKENKDSNHGNEPVEFLFPEKGEEFLNQLKLEFYLFKEFHLRSVFLIKKFSMTSRSRPLLIKVL